ASQRYYYGMVRVVSGSTAGLGTVGSPTAIGRDDSAPTQVHESGHNFGRRHAPCGGAANPDPSYPDPNAYLVSWGYDLLHNRLYNPASYRDLMSYCQPEWISEYNYTRVFA